MRTIIAMTALSFGGLALAACDTNPMSAEDAGVRPGADGGPGVALGEEHGGQFHLGPVDWAETEWTNACGPYPDAIMSAEGDLLAGVSGEVATPGSLCDACIEVHTAMGRSAVLRVVTYGSTAAPGDIDVSPEAYAMLDQGEFPRTMTWRLVTCPGAELYLQMQEASSQWWTSLWVRNPSMAVDRVEVRSANHADFFALRLGTDGTWTDDGGFGDGPFTLRVVGVSGATYDIERPGVTGGELVATGGNIPTD